MPNILIRDVPENIADAIAAKAGSRGREGYIRDLMAREADRLFHQDGLLLACQADIGLETVREMEKAGLLRLESRNVFGRRMDDRTWREVPETLKRAIHTIEKRHLGIFRVKLPSMVDFRLLHAEAMRLIGPEAKCPPCLRTEGVDLGLVPLDILLDDALPHAYASALVWRSYFHAVKNGLNAIQHEHAKREHAKLSAQRLIVLGRMLGITGAVAQSRPSLCIRPVQVRAGLHHSERSLVLEDHQGVEHGIQVSARSMVDGCLAIAETDELPEGDLIQVRLPRETDAGHWGLTFPMTSASIRRVPTVTGMVDDQGVYPLLEELRMDEEDLKTALPGHESAELLRHTLATVSTRGVAQGEGQFIASVARAVLDGLNREKAQ